MPVAEIPLEFYFGGDHRRTAIEAGETLIALSKLLTRARGPLATLAGSGTAIIQIEPLIISVESGSLLEKLLANVVWNGQEEMLTDLNKLGSLLRLREMTPIGKVLVASTFGLALYGANHAVDRVFGSKAAAPIGENYGTIINIISTEINAPLDIVDGAIRSGAASPIAVAREAEPIFDSARQSPDGILVGDLQEPAVTKESIRAFRPSTLDSYAEPKDWREVTGLRVQFARSDMDLAEAGWYVKIPEMSGERRIKARLVGLRPSEYHSGMFAVVDGEILIHTDRRGEAIPKEILIYAAAPEGQ